MKFYWSNTIKAAGAHKLKLAGVIFTFINSYDTSST